MNSRAKGKRGELEVASIYQEHGFDCRRTLNPHGPGDPQGVPGYWIEVKRAERLNVWKALDQAVRDCPEGLTPALHFRRNGDTRWWVAIPLDHHISRIS